MNKIQQRLKAEPNASVLDKKFYEALKERIYTALFAKAS